MFCPKCGANNNEGASKCNSCEYSFAALNTTAKVSATAIDALSSFKLFIKNPVGDLETAFNSIGEQKALGVGLTFGIVFSLLITILVTSKLPRFMEPTLSGYLKILLVSFVPFVSLSGAGYLLRQITHSAASLGHDAFIGGASLLPISVAAILTYIVGIGNIELIALATFFALVITILMLFTGTIKIYKISERQATFFVPAMIVFSAWITKIIYTSLFDSMF